ncbi:DUF3408 domain-containing protein [Flavobacterium sp. xlx-214]|uniref:DUF3408 domain-containing protein n=1 Tax=unclassified Flavobacterium TaxID=196869 RepID=UPI0013D45CD3|nr:MULTISPECIES: DUF3408 domain-containing protein [unclassified Flavobacterium]MBA5793469.1 DUF3408 domain-containing protein [Flavobacterium sp. xlx-221]QMI82759.1 DUF3408 domain-containing protein [Flavobacterium sp. xlx-214]
MNSENKNNKLKKPNVDEDYLMNIISGDETILEPQDNHVVENKNQEKVKSREKTKVSSSKKINYEETFLVNHYHSARSGKVVYIRPEYHERLLRMVQLTKEEKTTLYAYIDNILEHHFKEFGDDITNYFNHHFKPIL